MLGAPARDQALSLLAAAINHGDLAVKLSSLKQSKDIRFSVEPSQASLAAVNVSICLRFQQTLPNKLLKSAPSSSGQSADPVSPLVCNTEPTRLGYVALPRVSCPLQLFQI